MRRLFVCAAVGTALSVAGFVLQARAQGGGAQADMAAINGLLMQLNKGYQTKDSATITALMHDDVQGFGSSFNAANLAELREHSDRVLATIISAKLASKQDVTLSGNLAYVNYVMDVQMKTDQGPRAGRTRWTVIFRKMNNKWAVTHFHVSRDPTMS